MYTSFPRVHHPVWVQHEPSQVVPQWYAGYFELNTILPAGSREASAPPFNYPEELELGALAIIKDYQR